MGKNPDQEAWQYATLRAGGWGLGAGGREHRARSWELGAGGREQGA
jgi:hypothetical protein